MPQSDRSARLNARSPMRASFSSMRVRGSPDRRHQIAVGAVVGGVEERVRGRIVGERRDGVDRRPLDVDELLDARPVVGGDRADVRQHAGIVERGVDLAVGRIVVRARHRAQRARRHVAVRRHRIRADRLEVALLEVALVRHPRGPRRVRATCRTPAGTAPRSSRGCRRAATTHSISFSGE